MMFARSRSWLIQTGLAGAMLFAAFVAGGLIPHHRVAERQQHEIARLHALWMQLRQG